MRKNLSRRYIYPVRKNPIFSNFSNGVYRKEGSIFILTLWSLCLLSIFAIGLGSKVSQDINVASYFQNKPQARFLALAAIKRAEAILEDDTNSFDCLNEFWATGRYSDDEESVFNEAKLGNGAYSIGMVDEERKININTASQDVLERLFRIASGVDIDDAHIIASSIIDWRDTDSNPLEDGAEDSFYKQLKIPYECKDGNFQVIEELLLIRGMTDEIFLKVKDSITVYGEGKVNINTAGRQALYSLGMNDALTEKILFYRKGNDGIEGTEDDNVLKGQASITNDLKAGAGLTEEELNKIVELTSAGLLTVDSKNFSINAEGRVGRRREWIVCIVDKEREIKHWREE
ncbi:MAG: general secretion pathway protein GspK [Candidatus Omnitrophica bacterium]|nr:general secretion pathway protein GspK [Candidatus Omnitrophota bacterium]